LAPDATIVEFPDIKPNVENFFVTFSAAQTGQFTFDSELLIRTSNSFPHIPQRYS